ncbi:MAG: L,D-transpeptidase family protein [Phycisphaerales bacterium]|nr:L,D-transpeptidase family protein [Phycisphaerales bacterium]
MPLPSQSARLDARRAYMYRRKRFPRTPLFVLGAVLVGGVSWALLATLGGPDSASGDGGGSGAPVAGNGALTPPTGSGSPAPGGTGTGAAGERSGSQPPAHLAGANRNSSPTSPPTNEGAASPPRRDSSGDRAAASPPPAPGGTTGGSAGGGAPINSGADQTGASAPRQPGQPPSSIAAALALADSRPVEARRQLSAAVHGGTLSPADEAAALEALNRINRELVFSPAVHPDDPFARAYTVKSGETLERVVRNQSLLVDWRFIMRINRIQDERKVQAGQRIKLVTGPFHAVVSKSKYRLDLYLGDDADRVLVGSYKVGLGEYDSTPVGMFKIGSKLINPEWRNPRNLREHYLPDDPQNPLGERWIGLIGVDDNTREFTGYGIHGTIEPQTIGTQASMGCVRMLPDDVALIYEVLMPGGSMVEIRR